MKSFLSCLLFAGLLGLLSFGRPALAACEFNVTYGEHLVVPRILIPVVASQNGKLFAAGGTGVYAPYSAKELTIYDVATDSYSYSNISFQRGAMGTTTVGSKSILFGGEYYIGNDYYVSDTIEIYDANTDSWSVQTAVEGMTYTTGVTALDRFALFSGGFNADFIFSNRVFIYDLETDTWTNETMFERRFSHGCTTIKSTVYFVGGTNSDTTLDNMETYNVLTGEKSIIPLPLPLAYVAVAAFFEDRLLISGGDMFATPSPRLDIYHVLTNTWELKYFSRPFGHASFGVVPNRYFFLGGGYDMSGYAVDDIEIYNAITGEFTTAHFPIGAADSASLAAYTDPETRDTTFGIFGSTNQEIPQSKYVMIYKFKAVLSTISRISRVHGSAKGGLRVSILGTRLLGVDVDESETQVSVKLNGVAATVLSASPSQIEFITGACESDSCLGLGHIDISVGGRAASITYLFEEPQYASLTRHSTPAWFYTTRDGETLSSTWNEGSSSTLALSLSTLLPTSWTSVGGALTWKVYGHGNSRTNSSELFNSNSLGLVDTSASIPSALSSEGHGLGESSIGIVHLGSTLSDAVHYVLFSVSSNANPSFVFYGAVTVQEYLASGCPTVERLSSTETPASISESDYTVTFDAATETFHFEVVLPYVSDSFSWLADFTPFSPSQDDQNTIRSKTKCAHRPNGAITSGFDTTFASFPHAFYNDAISPFTSLSSSVGNTPYSPVASSSTDEFSGKWSLTPLSCSSLKLTAVFTVEELLSCTDSSGEHPSVTVSSESTSSDGGNTYLTYSGSLYVVYYRPLDRFSGYDETLYQTTASTLPFKFRFARDLSAVQSFTTVQTFSAGVESNLVDEEGLVHLRIKTLYNPSANLSATLGDRLLSADSETLVGFVCTEDVSAREDTDGACTNSASTTVCGQYFDCISSSVWNGTTDNGVYEFKFLNELSQVLNFELSLNHNIVRRASVDGLAPGSLSLQIRTFNSAAGFNSGDELLHASSFESSESIYLRTDVVVSTPNAYRDLFINYETVYICSPPAGYQISLEEGHFGCLDEVISSSNRVLLYGSPVDKESFTPGSSSAFDTLLITPTESSPSSTLTGGLGLRFNASPLTQLLSGEHQWFIHVVGSVAGIGGGHDEESESRRRRGGSFPLPHVLLDGSDLLNHRRRRSSSSSTHTKLSADNGEAFGLSNGITVRNNAGNNNNNINTENKDKNSFFNMDGLNTSFALIIVMAVGCCFSVICSVVLVQFLNHRRERGNGNSFTKYGYSKLSRNEVMTV